MADEPDPFDGTDRPETKEERKEVLKALRELADMGASRAMVTIKAGGAMIWI